MRKITVLSFLNSVLLGYLAWVRHAAGGCPGCHKVPFLPVNDVTLAISGSAAALLIAALSYFSGHVKSLRYPTTLLSAACATFASFLLAIQLLYYQTLCYLCLAGTAGFYLSFSLLLYDFTFKKLINRERTC